MFDALLGCAAQPAAEIVIDFQNAAPKVDRSKSSDDLALMKTKSISPGYGGEFPVVGGMTEGTFEVKYAMEFTSSRRVLLNESCLWAQTATITVNYTPTVYVASQYAETSCRAQATQEHEMRHVEADVDTLKQYIPYLKQITEDTTAKWGVRGPMKSEEVEATQKVLSQEVATLLARATEDMERARIIRQTTIDSAAEYRRLSALCPGEATK